MTRRVVPEADRVVERVTDRDSVAGFTAHHTSGHTPGHLTWVTESRATAFVGDLVRKTGGRLEPSPWYLCDDTAAVRSSLRRLRERDPPVGWLCPGNGEPVDGGIATLPQP